MSKPHVPSKSPHRPRHSWWWWTVAAILALFAILVVLGVSLWQATRYVPKFYAQRIAPPTVNDRQAGDEFERRVLELKNQVRHEGGWQTVLTEDQINGWLAVHLEEKFPESLPDSIKAPRVLLEPGKASLAARFTQNGVDSVMTVNISVFLTDRPTEVALQLRGVRAGLVPVPMKQMPIVISFGSSSFFASLR